MLSTSVVRPDWLAASIIRFPPWLGQSGITFPPETRLIVAVTPTGPSSPAPITSPRTLTVPGWEATQARAIPVPSQLAAQLPVAIENALTYCPVFASHAPLSIEV